MAMNDPIKILESAGVDMQQVPEGQRKVLQQLSPEEAQTLARIQQRLSSAGGEVQGYLRGDKGNIFF